MDILDLSRLLADTSEPRRECGPCTACCTVLAQDELQKPMRCACEHIVRNGCRIYHDRPRGCRDFNCLWLRGALPVDESLRPDHLGVLLDAFQTTGTNELRVVALEVWGGALDAPVAKSLINAIASITPVQLSNRDGEWQTRGSDG